MAFLPALDPAPGEAIALTLADDGSTRRWLPPGEPVRDNLRLGAGRAAPPDHRDAPAARIGVPGRLSWSPLRLRQVSLGPWDQPVALRLPVFNAVNLLPPVRLVASDRLRLVYALAVAMLAGMGLDLLIQQGQEVRRWLWRFLAVAAAATSRTNR